jgi:ferrochelatase
MPNASFTKKALVLVNLGSPEAPTPKALRKYLSAYLGDKRVITLPFLLRTLLVHVCIVPFRAAESARRYQKIWTPQGAPLQAHTLSLGQKLQQELTEYDVFTAMRHQQPNLAHTFRILQEKAYEEITVLPLFPQYASATSGSIIDETLRCLRRQKYKPSLRIIPPFYTHPAYIQTLAAKIQSYHPAQYDALLFSYHGLPQSHCDRMHRPHTGAGCNCRTEDGQIADYCYKGACIETTRLLAQALQLPAGSYSTSFQSRMSKHWISPYTDQQLVQMAQAGKKRILVVSPSFVADCLETLHEIRHGYAALFKAHGGKSLQVVEGLNDGEDWVKALKFILAK